MLGIRVATGKLIRLAMETFDMTKLIMRKGLALSLSAWCIENDVRISTASHRWKMIFKDATCLTEKQAEWLKKDRRTKLAKRNYCS